VLYSSRCINRLLASAEFSTSLRHCLNIGRRESVWDYPRPPRLVADQRHVVVRLGETIIADSRATVRILETAGPPTFYIPPKDVRGELLQPFPGTSVCEWKGTAKYRALKNFGASA
jgi:uncharacterized protein (DUF427 family)